MATRLGLHEELVNLLGTRNVYFQPPESFKMKYPCIRYSRTTPIFVSADNTKYIARARYNIVVITEDPDSDLAMRLFTHFQYCSADTSFTSDNLYHDVFTLVY